MYKNLAFVCVCLAVLFLSCGKKKEEVKKEEVIKIGAILPLSGDNAQYGIWIKEGLDLKTDLINDGGGINGKKLEILYEDDQAKAPQAANAMQKLANVDKVPIVFGSWASSAALAEAPIAEASKVVVMAVAISPKIRDAGDYIFRIQPDARYYIKALVPFIIDSLKLKTACVLYVNNDFGVDQKDVFKTEFEKLGGTVLSTEEFKQGGTDFRTQLLKMKAKKPTCIFIPAYVEAGYILKQAKEMGINTQFIGSIPFENPDILEIAGDAAEGVIFPHHFDQGSLDTLVMQYQKAYFEKYARNSEGFAALAYDGLTAIVEVIKKCGATGSCIKDELYKIKDLPGVTGTTTFDDHGDVVKPILIKVVKDGAFKRY